MSEIKEVPYDDKKINVSAVEMSCDDNVDQRVPMPLPQNLSFFMVLVGRPGSGKSTLLHTLTGKNGKNYNKKYDRVFYFNPSNATLPDDNPFASLPDDQRYEDLTAEDLFDCIEEIKGSGDRVLFIFDDCLENLKDKYVQKLIFKMAYNRRHLAGDGGCVAIMLTAQVYNRVPLPVRKCLTHLFLFETANRKELESLYDEWSPCPKNTFFTLLDYIYKGRHDFLFLDTQRKKHEQIHRNFNLLEYQGKNIYQQLADKN
tara:strand:- start:178 stop:951 length:774 start_codon:yes stop_codon:yes gene_type:complete